jgi:hypothetical protein
MPRMGVKVAKNLIDCGSRPVLAARARMLSILARRTLGECDETKMASAWVEAKAELAAEVPAWNKKGVHWGDGSTIWRVSRLKYLPW